MAFVYNLQIILIMYTNTRFQSTGTTSDFVQTYMNDKSFAKINIKINRNKHTAMYLSKKSQSFCKTSNYGTKFAPKNMTEKN